MACFQSLDGRAAGLCNKNALHWSVGVITWEKSKHKMLRWIPTHLSAKMAIGWRGWHHRAWTSRRLTLLPTQLNGLNRTLRDDSGQFWNMFFNFFYKSFFLAPPLKHCLEVALKTLNFMSKYDYKVCYNSRAILPARKCLGMSLFLKQGHKLHIWIKLPPVNPKSYKIYSWINIL